MTDNTDHRSALRSRSLDLLRYPLALVVLTVHLRGVHTHLMIDYAPWLWRFIQAYLSGISVPVYFFIAGYVFFLNVNLTRETYLRKMRNRFHSLFIPYVAWNMLAFAVACARGRIEFNGMADMGRELWYALVGAPGGLSYPADGPMWFVRDLMVMAAASPLLAWIFRHKGAWCKAAMGVIWANPATRHLGSWQLETAAFFFSWGAWMSFGGRDMMHELRRYRVAALIVYLAGSTAAYFLYGTGPSARAWCKTAGMLAGFVLAYNIAATCVKRGHGRTAMRLAPAAFFLYCSHNILLKSVGDIVYQAFAPLPQLLRSGSVLCGDSRCHHSHRHGHILCPAPLCAASARAVHGRPPVNNSPACSFI